MQNLHATMHRPVYVPPHRPQHHQPVVVPRRYLCQLDSVDIEDSVDGDEESNERHIVPWVKVRDPLPKAVTLLPRRASSRVSSAQSSDSGHDWYGEGWAHSDNEAHPDLRQDGSWQDGDVDRSLESSKA